MFSVPSILTVKKAYHFGKSLLLKAVPAAILTGFPGRKLQVYGITGTDGKTTSSTMLYHLLKTAGYKVALISTVAAYIGDKEIDTGFHVTSPEHWQVQQLLKRCVEEGIEHVVLEVTSHGIFQYRTWGIPFSLAGVTNISEEHFDYFLDYETYVKTKAELLLHAKQGVINAHDRSTELLRQIAQQHDKHWLEFDPVPSEGKVANAIRERFAESYNQANAQLVTKMGEVLGLTHEQMVEGIRSFPGVKGRMQEIPNNRGIKIVVDFAHTPKALESVLTALRTQTKGKLIAVFGCAGLRDRTKRPKMGRLGSQLADLAIFTAEDPRAEKLQVIIRQMKEGIEAPHHRKVVSIPDRREAILFALQQAQSGDVIAVLGKGHENSMCFGTQEIPWSDQKVIIELLREKK